MIMIHLKIKVKSKCREYLGKYFTTDTREILYRIVNIELCNINYANTEYSLTCMRIDSKEGFVTVNSTLSYILKNCTLLNVEDIPGNNKLINQYLLLEKQKIETCLT